MSLTGFDRTVFILGAGASYGDTLVDFDDDKETDCRIPLTNQFFRPEFLGGEIEAIKRDYSDLIAYVKANWNNNWGFGSGSWEHLNLEDVFTSLAIENEFAPSDTDEKARTQLRLNSLKRYIRKVIAKNSLNRYGKFTRQVVKNLKTQDSIITFNYDLLFDDAFIGKHSAEWLFRTALKGYRDVKIWIVNPLNDPRKGEDGTAFEKRMTSITLHKGVTSYSRFDQINDVLADVRSTG